MRVKPVDTKASRVAVVVSHPIQHFCPQYSSWAKIPGVDLRVFFASRLGLDSYHDKKFGRSIQWNIKLDFDHKFLPGAEGKRVSLDIDSEELDRLLADFDPHVVICYGYAQKIQKRAISWSRLHRRPILMIADSELRRKRGIVRSCAKKLLLPRVLSKISAFFTVGDANEAYYRNYAVSDKAMIRASFPIDKDAFDKAMKERSDYKENLRARLGIPANHLTVLMVGKMVSTKRQIDLVDAAICLQRSGIPISVLLAGTGDQEEEIRDRAQSHGLKSLHILGFVEPESLVGVYLGVDVYAHCSSVEAHSLAISEAIYAGLPVIVSDRCGSYGPSDDCRHGLNGFVYPCGDVNELANCIAAYAGSEILRAEMGKESRIIGEQAQALAHGKALLQALQLTRISGGL